MKKKKKKSNIRNSYDLQNNMFSTWCELKEKALIAVVHLLRQVYTSHTTHFPTTTKGWLLILPSDI